MRRRQCHVERSGDAPDEWLVALDETIAAFKAARAHLGDARESLNRAGEVGEPLNWFGAPTGSWDQRLNAMDSGISRADRRASHLRRSVDKTAGAGAMRGPDA
jgi:hypothetical protein